MKRFFFICCLIFIVSKTYALTSDNNFLPVYIEDYHTSSFYYYVKTLDWDQKYTLILIDKHSDATQVFDSDTIRKKLSTQYEIDTFTENLKKIGIIQCFNWIEPLMPHPISKVIWISKNSIDDSEKMEKEKDVKEELNAHEIAIKRKSSDLSKQFHISDFENQKNNIDFKNPVIVSLDLDYFTDLKDDELEIEFKKIIQYILSIKNLVGVTIAISNPYLKSSNQANKLLYLTFKYFLYVINTNIQFEPFTDYGEDKSNLAKEYYKKGLRIPTFDIKKANDSLKSLILNNKQRIDVSINKNKWNKLLSKWSKDYKLTPNLKLQKKNAKPYNRDSILFNEDFNLKIKASHKIKYDKIIWKSISSLYKSYNVVGSDFSFAEDASKFIQYQENIIDIVNNEIAINKNKIINLFDKNTGYGTIRIFAELHSNNEIYRTNTLRISIAESRNYIGKLTEIFNLPYILGSSSLYSNFKSIVDERYGADCANFIIYGKKRLGYNIPFGNPLQLKKYLKRINVVDFFKKGKAYNKKKVIKINNKQIQKGLLLHFRTHIVAVYKDTKPFGILDKTDLIIHQLEGYPEIVKLGSLKYIKNQFEIMMFGLFLN